MKFKHIYYDKKVRKHFIFEESITSSKASNMSMLGWWIVHTTVLPVSTVFLTVLITMAAALASRPDVGSSIKMIEGLATSSTAIVNLFLCSVDNPVIPGRPTIASLRLSSSTSSITSSTNFCKWWNYISLLNYIEQRLSSSFIYYNKTLNIT